MSPASVLPLCGVYSMDFLSVLSGWQTLVQNCTPCPRQDFQPVMHVLLVRPSVVPGWSVVWHVLCPGLRKPGCKLFRLDNNCCPQELAALGCTGWFHVKSPMALTEKYWKAVVRLFYDFFGIVSTESLHWPSLTATCSGSLASLSVPWKQCSNTGSGHLPLVAADSLCTVYFIIRLGNSAVYLYPKLCRSVSKKAKHTVPPCCSRSCQKETCR